MTTPTREQVIEWAKEARLPDNQSGAHFFNRNLEVLATLAHTAGRDQGLREAKEACQALGVAALGAQSGDPHELSNVMLRQVAKLGYGKCAAAIEQLRGE